MDGKPERVRERERANHSVEPTDLTAPPPPYRKLDLGG